MSNRLFVLTLWLGLMTVGLVSCGEEQVSRKNFAEERHIDGSNPLLIQHGHGRLMVIGWDKPLIRVEAVVRSGSQERLQACLIKIEELENENRLTTTWPSEDFLPLDSCNMKVTLPIGIDLKIQSQEGSVNTKKLEGDIRIDAENSEINIDGHEGLVSLKSSAKKVILQNIQGRVESVKESGTLQIMGVQDDLRIRMKGGPVDLDCFPNCTGKIDIDCENAAIRFGIGRKQVGKFVLEAKNNRCLYDVGSRGSAQVGRTKGQVTIVVGTNKPESTIRTTNRPIQVKVY